MTTQTSQQIDLALCTVERLVSRAAEGETDHYAGKRRSTRVSDGLQLEFTEALDQTPVPVTMHNISTTGCAFWIKRKLNIHSDCFVREFTPNNSELWIPGYVTHCTQGIRGYLVGIAFGKAP